MFQQGNHFLKIPCDQVNKMTINTLSKDTGGLTEITNNIAASERLMRTNHIMGAFKENLDA